MTAVTEVVPEFDDVFPFDTFNRMQAAALPAVMERDGNVVVSAPTASGKTALAELAICRTLAAGGTALFLAPLRALTNEREREWERFEDAGYSVYVVTGERDLTPSRAQRADILVMTPEKADSATRNHDSSRYAFVREIDCCIIDEVHLLDSDRRGSVLEVTISRLRRLCDPRIVALSATMRNIEDIAAWLDASEACTFAFDETVRPVPLHAGVETYAHGDNAFADKYRRLYRALDLAQPHIQDGGQALVFVASRQDTVRAAGTTRDEMGERGLDIGGRGDYEFHTATDRLSNETLRESVLDGVGFHHAGLARDDKSLVERWFREGQLPLLFSTSTLAWGVNLPARCVVIRDTKLHDPLEGEVDMSPLDLLQMLGRAGRPGYDDVGYAYVVCDRADAGKYRELLEEGTTIESRLADDLAGHMNAEIALGTIASIEDAMDWLATTFYAVRAQVDPGRYESGGDLRAQARGALRQLVEGGFVETDGDSVAGTPLGHLTSKFYLRLETAERFHDLVDRTAGRGRPPLEADDILRAVAGASEFDSVSARRDEREVVRAVVPEGDSLDPGSRKVLAILRASMDGSTPGELKSDAWVIRQNALRLLAALRAFLDRFADGHAANFARRIEARVDTGISADAVGLTAIDGIGAGRASRLAVAGLTSPTDVRAAGLEGLVDSGLSAGVAEQVLANVGDLPQLAFEWNGFPDTISRDERELYELRVRNVGGGTRAHILVRANGRTMTEKTVYLGQTTLPLVIYGGDVEAIDYTVSVAFPDLPTEPSESTRAVRVT